MDKHQITFIGLSNSLMVTFGISGFFLLDNKEKKHETGILAGFLFLFLPI